MNTVTIRLLNILKNSSITNTEFVCVNSNQLAQSIVKILYREGYILSFKFRKKENYTNNTSEILVYLRYLYNKSNLRKLKIISSPSRKISISYKQLTRISSKNKLFLFSTTKGLLTLEECKQKKVGGILFFIC